MDDKNMKIPQQDVNVIAYDNTNAQVVNGDDRAISAPPVLEFSAKTLFSYQSPFEEVRGVEPSYNQYYPPTAGEANTVNHPMKNMGFRYGGNPNSREEASDIRMMQPGMPGVNAHAGPVPSLTKGKTGTNSFLEAGSEISSIFGLDPSGQDPDDRPVWGTLDQIGGSMEFLNEQALGGSDSLSGSNVSAPVPVRARPPKPPVDPSNPMQPRGRVRELQMSGDALRSGGARSASPHHIIRSPFEESGWDSLALGKVFNNFRCKSADLGNGVGALNDGTNDDGELNDDHISGLVNALEGGNDNGAGLDDENSYLNADMNSPLSFDIEKLTLPPGMGRNGSSSQLSPAQPNSASMLQPMSPAQRPSDSSVLSQQVPAFGLDGHPNQYPPQPWSTLGNEQFGNVDPNMQPNAAGFAMNGMSMPPFGMGAPGFMPPDAAGFMAERFQDPMRQSAAEAVYAQSMQQQLLLYQLQMQMVQAQAQMGQVAEGGMPMMYQGPGVPFNPMMQGGAFPQQNMGNRHRMAQNKVSMNYGAGVGGFGRNPGFDNMQNRAPPIPETASLTVNINDRGRKSAVDVNKLISVQQVVGQIFSLSRDQLGCRFLQKQLEENTQMSLDIIFNEVIDRIVDLMTDPFGNYLCQKLLDYCNPEQRAAIVSRVAPHLVPISLNIHGTRAAQKLIERLGSDHYPTEAEIQAVVNHLKGGVIQLIQDLNGNHVVQRCLQKLDAKHNQFIYDAVAQHCILVASHRHGCCVFQRCVDFATPDQKHQVVMQVVEKTVQLVQDQYGNYVVQYVLEQVPAYRPNIVGIIAISIIQLSRQKFSSNVVEKCLQLASPEGQALMVTQLAQKEQILSLLQDPYANYVIQRALQVATTPQLEMLLDAIKPHLAAIRNTSYGRKIQSRVAKRCPGGIENMPSAEEAVARQAKKGFPPARMPGDLMGLTGQMSSMQLGGVSNFGGFNENFSLDFTGDAPHHRPDMGGFRFEESYSPGPVGIRELHADEDQMAPMHFGGAIERQHGILLEEEEEEEEEREAGEEHATRETGEKPESR